VDIRALRIVAAAVSGGLLLTAALLASTLFSSVSRLSCS
jgi:hypothetical protein